MWVMGGNSWESESLSSPDIRSAVSATSRFSVSSAATPLLPSPLLNFITRTGHHKTSTRGLTVEGGSVKEHAGLGVGVRWRVRGAFAHLRATG